MVADKKATALLTKCFVSKVEVLSFGFRYNCPYLFNRYTH